MRAWTQPPLEPSHAMRHQGSELDFLSKTSWRILQKCGPLCPQTHEIPQNCLDDFTQQFLALSTH